MSTKTTTTVKGKKSSGKPTNRSTGSTPMTMSGYCMWPSRNLGHGGCNREDCACPCHREGANDE